MSDSEHDYGTDDEKRAKREGLRFEVLFALQGIAIRHGVTMREALDALIEAKPERPAPDMLEVVESLSRDIAGAS